MKNEMSEFALDRETRKRIGHMVVDRINDYFESLSERSVQQPEERRNYQLRSEDIPEYGEDPETVLAELLSEFLETGFHTGSANYLGLMNPTPTYVAVLAEAIVGAFNPQLASFARSQTASLIEEQTIRWIAGLIGGEKRFGGTFTTGASEANLSALVLALSRQFPNAAEDGLVGLPRPCVFYASHEAHFSLDKAAKVLGLGRRSLRRIAVDRNCEMDLEQLENEIERDIRSGSQPFAIVATAGTTTSGAIDDLRGVARICSKYNLWFHIDGAYGAALLFSRQHRDLIGGIEQADSIAFDPHKWLAMPFASGILLTTREDLMERAFGVPAPYLQSTGESAVKDNYRLGMQWSRRMNSLKLWLTLRVHGSRVYEELICSQMRLANTFAAWIENSEFFEMVAPQRLPILAFSLRMPGAKEPEIHSANSSIVQAVTRDGKRWISLSTVAGKTAIRTMIISYLSGPQQVQDLQDELLSAARTLLLDTRAQEHAPL